MCVTDFDISPNSIYQQQEQHVLVTVSLFMDLTITYEYQSLISNDINILCCVCFYFVALDVSLGFHFLLRVCYVNPAYGCQIEINCMYVLLMTTKNFWKGERPEDNASAPSSFIANVHIKLYILYTGKGGILKNNSGPIGGGRPHRSPSWISHWWRTCQPVVSIVALTFSCDHFKAIVIV